MFLGPILAFWRIGEELGFYSVLGGLRLQLLIDDGILMVFDEILRITVHCSNC